MIGLDVKHLEELAEMSAKKAVEEYCRRNPRGSQVERLVLTTAEAAELLGIGSRSCEKLCREGKLPAIQIAGFKGWRIRRRDLEAWLEEQHNGETAA